MRFARAPDVAAALARDVRGARAEVIETHMSWVFLVGDRAYKLKKPVRTGRVDFSTLGRRFRACADEVRLNRRLAASVYLGIRPVTDAAGGVTVGGRGDIVDWLVVMRRLDRGLMLDAQLAAGLVRRPALEQVGRLLARFHRALPPERMTAGEYRALLARGVAEDGEVLRRPEYGLPAAPLTDLVDRLRSFIADERELLAARVSAGRVVEGHGDLRPEHVCLEPRPVIIDCLEFDRELRVGDGFSELAFLALECRRLGHPTAGATILAAYAAAAHDDPPACLLRFYQARHALARAKVAIWHLDDPGIDGHERWIAKARTYLALAAALDLGGSSSSRRGGRDRLDARPRAGSSPIDGG